MAVRRVSMCPSIIVICEKKNASKLRRESSNSSRLNITAIPSLAPLRRTGTPRSLCNKKLKSIRSFVNSKTFLRFKKKNLQILNRSSKKVEPEMFINNIWTIAMYRSLLTKFSMMNCKFIYAINEDYCKITNQENTIQPLPSFPVKQKGIA